MKRHIIHILQSAAFAVFAGICIYGILIFQSGERSQKLPFWESLLMGLGAVVAATLILVLGGIQDRLAQDEETRKKEMEDANGGPRD